MKSDTQPATQTLLIATHNRGKIAEYRLLIVRASRANHFPGKNSASTIEAPETGDSFAANARQKASAYCRLTGLRTWADDSGLEVDALDGRPGVLSARYGGEGLNDRDRYLLLLEELPGVPEPDRTARFRCAVCIASPAGEDFVIEDSVEGVITSEPVGDHGFGFDPVFFLPEFEMTMAQLPAALKNQISHRGKAARAAKQKLANLLAGD